MGIDSPVSAIRGVGPKSAQALSRLNIFSVSDLLMYLPRQYEDYSRVLPINQIRPGKVTIKAKIISISARYSRKGLHITEAVASDKTGSVRLIWFNQPYRATSLTESNYYISGEFELRNERFSILNPSVELVSDFTVNTARILPVYRQTKNLKSAQIRKYISSCRVLINNLEETLPSWLVDEAGLMPLNQAVMQMHFPASNEMLDRAKYRLAFEEVLSLMLASVVNKNENQSEKSPATEFNKSLAVDFVNSLPFKLTDSQKKVAWEVLKDMQSPHPMNRLIEGDVGSGKTVVATMATMMCLDNNYQVALLAPTQILANQHYQTISEFLSNTKYGKKILYLDSTQTRANKDKILKQISKGEELLIIGTSALLQEKVNLPNLGLVIVDEQHRFGVDQRRLLHKKAPNYPHLLSMSATPIPRSLALTLYGELDISVITTKPPNRGKVTTKIVTLNQRSKIYEQVMKSSSVKNKVFVVCPLIQESDDDFKRSAEKVYKELSKKFPEVSIGLLHGKMKNPEKEKIMEEFVTGKITCLVSTTVIEVGVDVPYANTLIIEDPSRFGLAQIHQLRGRIGRRDQDGMCYLALADNNRPSKRILYLEQLTDGFKLAEIDLNIRGPGAIYGTKQHGALDLKVASLNDPVLLSKAKNYAKEFLRRDNLIKYKQLNDKVAQLRSVTSLN